LAPDPISVLQKAATLGIELALVEGEVRLRAHKGVLTPPVVEELRAAKPFILKLLDKKREMEVDPVGPPPQARCPSCRSPSFWWDAKAPAWRCQLCQGPGDRLVACYTLGLPLLGLCPWCGAPRQENPAWDPCDGGCGEPICPNCLLCSPTCMVLTGVGDA
jgi:hypothetical protein